MTRITKSNLIAEINDVNHLLIASGSGYTYKYGHRNGYHAVDLMQGSDCVRCLDCGETPKVLIAKVWEDHYYYLNK